MNVSTGVRSCQERLAYSLRDYGAWGTAVRSVRKLVTWASPLERNFDHLYGVSTVGRIDAHDLNIGAEVADYNLTPARFVAKLIRCLPIDYSQWSLVDVGCGKGRALIVAGTFPFSSVVGIELSELLVECATRNVNKFYGDPHCQARSVRTVHADAPTFPISNRSVVYLNNPFRGRLMQRFVDRLLESTAEKYVIYWNNKCRHMFLRPEFKVIRQGVGFSVFRHP